MKNEESILNPERIIPAGTETTIEVIDNEGNTYYAYLRKIDKKTLSSALANMYSPESGIDMITTGEIVLRSLMIGGDSQILDEDEITIAAALKAMELVKVLQANLKKN